MVTKNKDATETFLYKPNETLGNKKPNYKLKTSAT